MKRLGAALLVCAALIGPAGAQNAPSPGSLRAAQELATLLGGESMTQVRAAIMAQVWASVEPQIASRADTAAAAEMRGEFERSVAELTSDMMKDAPTIYALISANRNCAIFSRFTNHRQG